MLRSSEETGPYLEESELQEMLGSMKTLRGFAQSIHATEVDNELTQARQRVDDRLRHIYADNPSKEWVLQRLGAVLFEELPLETGHAGDVEAAGPQRCTLRQFLGALKKCARKSDPDGRTRWMCENVGNAIQDYFHELQIISEALMKSQERESGRSQAGKAMLSFTLALYNSYITIAYRHSKEFANKTAAIAKEYWLAHNMKEKAMEPGHELYTQIANKKNLMAAREVAKLGNNTHGLAIGGHVAPLVPHAAHSVGHSKPFQSLTGMLAPNPAVELPRGRNYVVDPLTLRPGGHPWQGDEWMEENDRAPPGRLMTAASHVGRLADIISPRAAAVGLPVRGVSDMVVAHSGINVPGPRPSDAMQALGTNAKGLGTYVWNVFEWCPGSC